MVTMPPTPEAVRAHAEVRSMLAGQPETVFGRGLAERGLAPLPTEGCPPEASGQPRGRIERLRRAVGLASPPRWCM
jgi:hypothetical protein